MSRFAEGIEMGERVKKGEVIGYVGDSGYGPEGTTGKFPPHLHFGIYVRESLLSRESESDQSLPVIEGIGPEKIKTPRGVSASKRKSGVTPPGWFDLYCRR